MKPRFTSPHPGEMSPQQRAIYELFSSGRRADPSSAFSLVDKTGRLQGPPAAWVLTPRLGRALEQLGSAIRFELTLPGRAREIAILMVAHHYRSPFELHAHTMAAAAEGVSPAELQALAVGESPELGTDVERVVYSVTRQILDSGTLDDREYAEAAKVITVERLFELITLIGYYVLLAIQLSVFDLHPPGHPKEAGQ